MACAVHRRDVGPQGLAPCNVVMCGPILRQIASNTSAKRSPSAPHLDFVQLNNDVFDISLGQGPGLQGTSAAMAP